MGQLSSALGAGGARHVEATLEKIISDVAAENEFQLYKLVNYRRGGSIMESCAAVGASGGVGIREVDRICSQVLINYVYDKGRGKTITAAETLAWRRRLRKEVAIPVPRARIKPPPSKNRSNKNNSTSVPIQTSVLSPSRPYDTPLDHEGCWILDQRGALGENPLHVLVICDTPTHTRVAKILLSHYPKLVNDIMEGTEYCGLSPLHLAVAYNNMELVQAFVAAGANVNERAVGKFFMPSDQKERPKRKTNYEGLSYLGEYPLSWAACCENEAIYNYLLDRGSDPNLQDTFGNMILHMVVISNKLGMYGYALRHPKKPANNEIVNRAGLTPLTLACVLGRNNIFREMLELSSVEFWRFSNITCSAYPLIALDTIRPDGGTNWKSALMIILDGETQEHLDMLEGGVIQRLLEDKWKTFARNQFLKRLGVLFLHLIVISIAVYLRPPFEESLKWSSDPKNIARHCAEFGSLLGCGLFVFVQQGSEIISQGFVEFVTNLARSPAKFIFLISNVCILICIPCRLLSMRLVEDSLLTFALPGTWFFLMFFAGAVRLTGPFVTMIYSMIAGDMVRFGIIYLIMLLGFSQAFYFLFKSCHVGSREADDTNIDLYETFIGTWMALYQMTLGNYQYSDFSKPKYSGLSLTIFVVFMVLVPILLLNMLIAMMGNTYANVISKSEKEFVKQWAKIVLALERSVDKKNCKEHLNTYGINLGPPPSDGSEPMKGLMVIKSKNKTKAQQRKGALLNWRRVGKKIVGEMRKYGCKGDQLLQTKSQEMAKKGIRRGSFPALFSDNADGTGGDDDQLQPPRGGLGEALSQLAFAHDIDITGGVVEGAPGATQESSFLTTQNTNTNQDTNCNTKVIQPNSQSQMVTIPNCSPPKYESIQTTAVPLPLTPTAPSETLISSPIIQNQPQILNPENTLPNSGESTTSLPLFDPPTSLNFAENPNIERNHPISIYPNINPQMLEESKDLAAPYSEKGNASQVSSEHQNHKPAQIQNTQDDRGTQSINNLSKGSERPNSTDQLPKEKNNLFLPSNINGQSSNLENEVERTNEMTPSTIPVSHTSMPKKEQPVSSQQQTHYPIMHLPNNAMTFENLSPSKDALKCKQISDNSAINISKEKLDQPQPDKLKSFQNPNQNPATTMDSGMSVNTSSKTTHSETKIMKSNEESVPGHTSSDLLLNSDISYFSNNDASSIAENVPNTSLSNSSQTLPASTNSTHIQNPICDQKNSLLTLSESTAGKPQTIGLPKTSDSRLKFLDRQGTVLSTDSVLQTSSAAQQTIKNTSQSKSEDSPITSTPGTSNQPLFNDLSQNLQSEHALSPSQPDVNLHQNQNIILASSSNATGIPGNTQNDQVTGPISSVQNSQAIAHPKASVAERGELILQPSELQVPGMTSLFTTTNTNTKDSEFLSFPSQSGTLDFQPLSSGFSSPSITHKYRHQRMSSAHRTKAGSSKSKRSKKKGFLHLNKLTNKVGVQPSPFMDVPNVFASTPISSTVSTIDNVSGFLEGQLPSHNLFQSALPVMEQPASLQPLRGYRATLPRIPSSSATASLLPSDPRTLPLSETVPAGSHPLNRWSTNSIVAMSSLVDWEDGADMASDSQDTLPFNVPSSLDNDGDIL